MARLSWSSWIPTVVGNAVKVVVDDLQPIAQTVRIDLLLVLLGLEVGGDEVLPADVIATVVSGTTLEDSEDTVAAGDVVIYAKIDGKVRAQKAESETSRFRAPQRLLVSLASPINREPLLVMFTVWRAPST